MRIIIIIIIIIPFLNFSKSLTLTVFKTKQKQILDPIVSINNPYWYDTVQSLIK